MKNEEACGMGCFLVAILNSDSRLGLADTPSTTSISSLSEIFSHTAHCYHYVTHNDIAAIGK